MRAPNLLRALAAAVAWGAAAPSPAAEVTPPVPLRTSPLFVPVETAGTGLAPEARVRIGLDARGVVERVEVLSIAPASEFDELFRTTLERTLRRWRYAPQLRDGVPEATTLDWRVRLPAREEAPAPAAAGAEATATAAGPVDFDAETLRARILALPERQRARLLDSELRAAVRQLDPSRLREARTDWVVVRSDVPDERVAGVVAANLDAIFRTLATKLVPGLELSSENLKLQVVVYAAEESYRRLVASMPHFEWSAGFYSPSGLVAFHLEQSTDDAATHILLHEATHAFLDRHVVRRGVALPRWLGEGFADYIGNSQVKKGLLVPGRTLSGKFEMGRHGAVRIRTVGALQLDAARAALRRGRGLGVPALLAATPETFYGENREIFYASAWLLVHFLRDGEPGWAQERFPRLLLYLAEGYPVEAVVARLYGDPAALDAAFRRYVQEF